LMRKPVISERQKKALPPQRELLSLLRYEPLTGRLYWLPRPHNHAYGFANSNRWNANFAHRQAFTSKCRNGYLAGKIGGRTYLAHRIIWKIAHGLDPDFIDHINGRKDDNSIANLRSIPYAENTKNKALHRNNKSGIVGVRRDGSAWRAVIQVDGKKKNLGRHQRIEDAIAARRSAEQQYGFHQNHGSSR
jgi:hypothetical protein